MTPTSDRESDLRFFCALALGIVSLDQARIVLAVPLSVEKVFLSQGLMGLREVRSASRICLFVCTLRPVVVRSQAKSHVGFQRKVSLPTSFNFRRLNN